MAQNIDFHKNVTDLKLQEDFLKKSLYECSQALDHTLHLLISRGERNNILTDLLVTAVKCQEMIRCLDNP